MSALEHDIVATLMPGFSGTVAPDWMLDALRDGLQAVCLYGNNVRDRDQLAALGRALRGAAPTALIAIDEEGGDVTRLHYAEGAPYPGAAVLGRIDDPAYTEEIGARVGRDLLAAGCTLALAPVADVNSDPENPVIGTRSFGDDPALVARHVAAWGRGLQSTGAIACPKHFPGHGATTQDSHLTLPTVDASSELVDRRDLPPFRAAIAAGARAIMTSHILLPRLDGSAPATFSRPILQGLLRDRLGFDGVIVSDALDMRGASGGIGIPEAAVRALAAGCDLLCLGTSGTREQLDAIVEHVATAVHEGRLDGERIREAAARVRALTGPFPVPTGLPPEASASRVPAAGAPSEADGSPSTGGADAASSSAGSPGGREAGSGARTADGAHTAELARIAASFDGVEAARAWLAAHPGAGVIRVEAEANQAVGEAPWGPFAAAAHPFPGGEGAARSFAARSIVAVDAGSGAPWPVGRADPEAGVIVVGRNLHRGGATRGGLAALSKAGIPILAVEMGWPAAPITPPPVERGILHLKSTNQVRNPSFCASVAGAGPKSTVLSTYGSSRLVGAALLALLRDPEGAPA